MGVVLVVSMHPDDETLGCGGSILKHVDRGDEVHWVVVTQPHSPTWTDDVIEEKAREVDAVARAFRFASSRRLSFGANELERTNFNELIDALRDTIVDVSPDTVYSVSGGDIHSDHEVGFKALTVVAKPFYTDRLGVRRLLCYETLSSTDAAPALAGRAFVPQVFSDITPYLDRKVEIMSIYGTEAQPDPMPRGPSAIRALARTRGATIGVEYAEAFCLIRDVI